MIRGSDHEGGRSSVGRASAVRNSGGSAPGEWRFLNFAVVAQLVERVLGKDEVTGSIPVNGSRIGKWLVCAAEDFDGAAVPWDGFRSPRTNQN